MIAVDFYDTISSLLADFSVNAQLFRRVMCKYHVQRIKIMWPYVLDSTWSKVNKMADSAGDIAVSGPQLISFQALIKNGHIPSQLLEKQRGQRI